MRMGTTWSSPNLSLVKSRKSFYSDELCFCFNPQPYPNKSNDCSMNHFGEEPNLEIEDDPLVPVRGNDFFALPYPAEIVGDVVSGLGIGLDVALRHH